MVGFVGGLGGREGGSVCGERSIYQGNISLFFYFKLLFGLLFIGLFLCQGFIGLLFRKCSTIRLLSTVFT